MSAWFWKSVEDRVSRVVSLPADLDDAALVAALADRVRAEDAYWLLMSRGESVVPAVRDGLRHQNPDVRYHCCRVLDHFLTEEVLPELVAMLDDTDARVLMQVLHSLTCERCKEGECRPDGAVVLAGAVRLMEHFAEPHVRAMAAEVVGASVHDSADALQALERVHATDPSSSVRKKVSWYLPGGPIYRKTAPTAPTSRN